MVKPQRLKVLRVVTTAECVPWHMANTLERLSKDFDVCLAGHGVSKYQDEYPDVLMVNIPIIRKVNPVRDLFSLISLCKLIFQFKPDIVHSIMPKAGLVSAFAGFVCRVPVRIHTFTGQVWATKSGLARISLKLLDRLIVIINTNCLTDSYSQSGFLYSNGIKKNGRPLPVLAGGSLSGVDLNRFNFERVSEQSSRLRAQLGFDDRNFVFVFLGRKNLDKGVAELIRAFEETVCSHPNARLLLVGPDESDGKIGALEKSRMLLAKQIVDVGCVDEPEIYLAVADVFCIPSFREGFGTVVIEAGAMGLPTIGSDIPGLVDAIEDGVTGILFPAGDTQRLAAIMKTFLEQPQLAKRMGAIAKERVLAKFSANVLYDALKNLYLAYCNGSNVKAASKWSSLE